MSVKDRGLDYIEDFTESFDNFDLTDRVIVGIFMSVVELLAFDQAKQSMTASELAESAFAFESLGWLAILFILWPIIRELLKRLEYALVNFFRGDDS